MHLHTNLFKIVIIFTYIVLDIIMPVPCI